MMPPAVTEYASGRSWAKAWQHEYRYGVWLIYPPEPHRSAVTALRERYAWSQSSRCDAHISLSLPLPRPVTAADVAELQAALSQVQPFRVSFGPLVRQPAHRGVVLEVSPQDSLRALLEKVEATSAFAGAVPRKYPFWAHLTIAEMVTWEQTYAIIEELADLPLSGEFDLAYLSYAVPDEEFSFTERARVYLGRADTPPAHRSSPEDRPNGPD